ncbi:hypothetical protein AB0I95_10865 [Micromonospora sp. NPDC049751]|uniref:hypothetical protein n=1 Tax=Micromonospora sp. NPDC049751 TaxID=3154837 RepID=UPI0033EB9D20
MTATKAACDRLILLDGATGSGKSTVLEHARHHDSGRFGVVRKVTDRPRRLSDNDWEFEFRQEVPDDGDHVRWSSVGWQYALPTATIEGLLHAGRIPVVICTDPSVIALLREAYTVVVVYVYRPLTPDELERLLVLRGTVGPDAAARRLEHHAVVRDYAGRIAEIDAVLLNIGTTADLTDQFDQVARALTVPGRSVDQAAPMPYQRRGARDVGDAEADQLVE